MVYRDISRYIRVIMFYLLMFMFSKLYYLDYEIVYRNFLSYLKII